MSNKQKSIFGSALLVSGCCIGAGMLGLPLATLSSGFMLSLIPLLGVWIYMYFSGLMLLEVYLEKKQNINLMTLLSHTLGKKAKLLGSALFLFLFYSILTAYLSSSSVLFKDAISTLFHVNLSEKLSLVVSACILFAIVILRLRKIDLINRLLVFCMLIFYICLIITGIPQVKLSYLSRISHYSGVIWSIPVFIVSFGFQNLIPTISYYLKYDVKNIKAALFRGTLITLFVYLLWNLIVLGMLSGDAIKQTDSTSTFLRALFGQSFSHVGFFINSFAIFAIVTSLISVSLSFVNFLADASDVHKGRFFYASLVMVPPTVFALMNPDIFLLALHLAGGIGAVCLFGILPALMIWKVRYVQRRSLIPAFPFGKKTLALYLILSFSILGIEISNLILQR